MSMPIRSIVCGLLLFGAFSCGDDDDGGDQTGSDAGGSQSSPDSGRGGNGGAGRGGSGGSSASGRGGSSAGSGGSTAGTGAGTGGSSAGTGGSSAGTGGTGGTGGSDPDQDAGVDPGPSTCKAPTTNASSGNTCPAGGPPALKLTTIKTGLDVPILVTQPPGDDSRLFVVLRSGRILLIDPENGADMGEFMMVPDVRDSGGSGGEMGLLGLAFHPNYPTDPRFFVYFIREDGPLETVIASFEVMDNDPNKGDPATFAPVVTYPQVGSFGNHKGGMLAFGPDGCLFAGSGDGGNSNDEGGGRPAEGWGQTLSSPLGKILRIDVDDPSMAAPGNLGGANTYRHVWDYGVRNPWRFSFDRSKGDLYIGDVGQGAWEEVDVEPKGAGKKNYGWKIMEGEHCGPDGAGCDMTGLTLPVHEYPHVNMEEDCIVGGYVYRGSAIPQLQGWYLYGDNGPRAAGRVVRALVWDGQNRCQETPPKISQTNNWNIQSDITSFGEDVNGELYITTLNGVYRIDAQ